MTSLKISEIAGGAIGVEHFVGGDDSAEAGAWLSVAKALSHASRRLAPWPTPQGFMCFRMASVGASFSNSAIRRRCGSEIENIVVKLIPCRGAGRNIFENRRREHRAFGADFRRNGGFERHQH